MDSQPSDRKIINIPSRARLMAVALPELWRTRPRLGMVEGFDLSLSNNVLGVVSLREAGGRMVMAPSPCCHTLLGSVEGVSRAQPEICDDGV